MTSHSPSNNAHSSRYFCFPRNQYPVNSASLLGNGRAVCNPVSLPRNHDSKKSQTKQKPQKYIHTNQINKNAMALTDLKKNNQPCASLFNLPNVRRLQTSHCLFYDVFSLLAAVKTNNAEPLAIQSEARIQQQNRERWRRGERRLAQTLLTRSPAKFTLCKPYLGGVVLTVICTKLLRFFLINHLNNFFYIFQTSAPVIPFSTRLKTTLYLVLSPCEHI